MNWKERIEKAEESGTFTDLDMYLAGKWNSCAVGEKLRLTVDWFDSTDSILPSRIFWELHSLGTLFSECVCIRNDPKLAARLYKQINEIKVK